MTEAATKTTTWIIAPAHSVLEFDRKDFGLTWKVTLESGGMLVSDEVTLSLAIQAARSGDQS